KDEQPKAVGNDDALRFRTAVAVSGIFGCAVGEPDGRRFGAGGHVDWLRLWRCSMRIRRRSRALARTSSTGMICSCSSRQAYQTKIANAPMRPTTASHQIYQIIAKPQTVAKNATVTPVGVFTGISIGW